MCETGCEMHRQDTENPCVNLYVLSGIKLLYCVYNEHAYIVYIHAQHQYRPSMYNGSAVALSDRKSIRQIRASRMGFYILFVCLTRQNGSI